MRNNSGTFTALRKQTPSALLTGLFFVLFFNAANTFAEDTIPPPRTPGDAFVEPSSAEPTNLVPFLAADSASAEVSHFMFSGLLRYGGDLELIGDLAAGWWILDDGLRIVFEMRKSARWHDGVPVTAEDVVFTWQKIMDPSVATPYSGAFEKVESVKALDDLHVEVRYKEPFSPGLASWTMGIVPKHILEHQDLYTFSQKPIGSGPYKLKQWNHGDSIELVPHLQCHLGKPYLERVFIKFIPDSSTTFLELQNENLDTAPLTPIQFSKQIDTPFFKEKYNAYRFTGLQYTYLGFNLNHPLFQDKRVRKAIGLAINRDAIIEGALLGYGRPVTGPFLYESWGANPNVRPLPYDVDQAKKLLAEAGYTDSDKDGWLDKDGQKFSFTVLTNSDNDERKATCELIQQDLKKVGIEIKIEVVEWGVLLNQHVYARNFEAVVIGWNLALDPDVYDIFHSSRTGPGGFNYVGYQNDEVDELLVKARRVFDRMERAKAYYRIHEIIADEMPYVFLYSAESLTVLHKRFRDAYPGRLGLGHDFIAWNVAPADRKYGPFPEDA